MFSKNKNASKCFDKMISNFSKAEGSEKDLLEGMQSNKTRLSKDDKGARVNARIDALLNGKEFDESKTPIEELETIDDDIIEELTNREIEKFLGD